MTRLLVLLSVVCFAATAFAVPPGGKKLECKDLCVEITKKCAEGCLNKSKKNVQCAKDCGLMEAPCLERCKQVAKAASGQISKEQRDRAINMHGDEQQH